MPIAVFQQHTSQLSNARQLAYWKRPGKHQTIILLHGFSGDHAGLIELAELLPKSAEIILPDLPGFGMSDDPSQEAQQSVITYAACLDEVIGKLASTDNIVLIGHSFGCMVAFSYAAQHQHKIKGVIGICPLTTRKVLPRLLGAIGTAAFRRFGFERSKRILAWPPLVDIETYYLLRHLPKERYDIVKNNRRHEASLFRASTFTMFSAVDGFRDDTDALRITCPALYIAASDDNVAGKSDIDWFYKHSTDAQVHSCRGGHLAPVVFPEEIAQCILDARILLADQEHV